MTERPKAFIGSSREGLPFAQAIQVITRDELEIDIWDQITGLNRSILDHLLDQTERYDVGIFILTPDDVVMSRGSIAQSGRDNVIFEAGLFMGKLGKNQTFIVLPSDSNFKVLTDLGGVHLLKYDLNGKADAITDHRRILGSICSELLMFLRANPIKKRIAYTINGKNVDRVGVICLRKNEMNDTELLLVNNTKHKRIIPKGKIVPGADLKDAAKRCALDEAGVIGRILDIEPVAYEHYKEEENSVQNVASYFLEFQAQVEPSAPFRDPQWFTIGDALGAVSTGRSSRFALEMHKAIEATRTIFRRKALAPLVAALPYRKADSGKIEILLVTGRTSGIWILPKGHIRKGESAPAAAVREAREEGGVIGNIANFPVFRYVHVRNFVSSDVDVYPMEVTREDEKWPEASQRQRLWLPTDQAANKVQFEDLKQIILDFDDRMAV